MVAVTRTPPTIRELLADDEYKRYFLQAPRMPEHLTRDGQAWGVWARATREEDGATVWRGTRHGSYREAIQAVSGLLKMPNVLDIAVVSRRVSYRAPEALVDRLTPRARNADWCRRCRRPSLYTATGGRHAQRQAPVISLDEPESCFYCGGRRVTFGDGAIRALSYAASRAK